MTRALFLLLILFSTRIVATPASPQSIHIVSFPLPPYIIVKKEQPTGILIELLQTLFTNIGVEVQFSISNWARAYAQIEANAVDAIIPTLKTPKRQKRFLYPTTELALFEMVLVGNKENLYQFNGQMNSLIPYSIGRIRNAKVSPQFDVAINEGKLNIKERNSIELLTMAVVRQRLDLAAMERRAVKWSAINNNVLYKLQFLQPALGIEPVYIAFNRNTVSHQLVLQVDRELIKLQQNGTVNAIVAKYMSQEE